MVIFRFCTAVVLLGITATTKSKNIGSRQTNEALNYLEQYGYYSKPSFSVRHGGNPPPQTLETSSVQSAIKRLQEFFGLPQTGKLDQTTAKLMAQPRCGVPDVSDNGLRANFEVRCTNCKFSTSEVTYAINEYSNKISRGEVEREVGRAFKSWSDVTNLKFKKTKNRDADIRISFHGAEHNFEPPGDDGFTGPVLAHAWFPPDGRLHFDEQETWTTSQRNEEGVRLYAVALHEIGHNLGLRHSGEKNSIMWPSIQPEINELSSDDINGIQSLYGKPTISPPLPIIGFQKERATWCKGNEESYNSLDDAIKQCRVNSECVAVWDNGCDDKGPFDTCLSTGNDFHDSNSPCIYKKGCPCDAPTAECISCDRGITILELCKEADSQLYWPSECSKGCPCGAPTAECIACERGITILELCKEADSQTFWPSECSKGEGY